jgi:hypothetical protein
MVPGPQPDREGDSRWDDRGGPFDLAQRKRNEDALRFRFFVGDTGVARHAYDDSITIILWQRRQQGRAKWKRYGSTIG